MTETEAREFFTEAGYFMVRRLDDGRWIGLQEFLFTIGLCVDLSERHGGYETRFCFEKNYSAHAVSALLQWDGSGDPSGPWLKQKGSIERMNPNHPRFKNIPITTVHKS